MSSEKDIQKNYQSMPPCFSEYEKKHPTCNGDPDGESDEDREPCLYRDGCLAIQLRMEEKGYKLDQYLSERTDSEDRPYRAFLNLKSGVKIILKQIERYQIKDGATNRKPKVTTRRSTSARPPKVQPKTPKQIELDETVERWKQIIVEGLRLPVAESDANPRPGEIYYKDRRDPSKYISAYVKPAKGRAVALSQLVYKPRSGLMNVKFPIEPGAFQLGGDVMKKLKPVPDNDGAFRSVCKLLEPHLVILAAESLIQMINDRVIVLPDVD